LSSLQEAHEAGIVHRDIKPANVMLVRRRKGGDDQVKLLDFGIAKLQEAEGRKSTTGDFVGTPAYMSPEQIRGEDVDARSDLYSLGALLFELVTGKQMFDGPTPITIINLHTQGVVPTITEVNPAAVVRPAFEAVLRRALSKRADDRYRDADAMRAALEALRTSEPVRSASYTPMPDELSGKMLSREDFDAFERTLRFQRTFTPLVVLVVLMMLIIGGWKALSTRPVASVVTAEVEPNDDPREANHIALDTDVTGSMGASKSEFGDRDLFVVDVPGGPTRITLSGVPDLNLTLEVLQMEKTDEGDKLRRKVFVDDVGVSGSERLDALWLARGATWVRVQERPFCIEPNRPPRERALVPYTLRVEPMTVREAAEVEPNDTPSTAQVLSLTMAHALTAFAGERLLEVERANVTRPDAPFSSPDFFRVEVDEGETAMLAVVPPVRGALLVTVLDEAEPKRTRVVEVKTTPMVLELKGARGGRRVRVIAGKDTLPGDSYLLAVGSAEHGVAALVDLAGALHEDGRDETRRLIIDAALQKLPGASELAHLER
jgi:serine/threonine-protein kinase